MTDTRDSMDQEVQEPQPPRDQWPFKAVAYFVILVLIWIGMYISLRRAYLSNGSVLSWADPYSWLALFTITITVAFVSPLLVYFAVMADVEERDLARKRDFWNQQNLNRQERTDAWVKEEIARNIAETKLSWGHAPDSDQPLDPRSDYKRRVDFGLVNARGVPVPPNRPVMPGHNED